MSYTPDFKYGPAKTPIAIKKLIIFTLSISFISALTTGFFNWQLGTSGPQQWLSLSWWGMSHYLWWQPVTFLFVHNVDLQGITFGWFLHIFFNMAILWVMGTELIERVGKSAFLKFYFVTGILSGLLTFLLMPIFGTYSSVSGATPAILALLTVWTLLHPEQEILLFFLLPLKAKWLSATLLAVLVFTNFIAWSFASLSLCLFGILTGYLYALIGWDIHSPFVRLYRLELAILRLSEQIRQILCRFHLISRQVKTGKGNILDITTEQTPLDNEAFTQAMLRKMAKKGYDSLSWQEKQRLKQISDQKSQKK